MDEIKALGSIEEIKAILEQTKSEENTIHNLIQYHLQTEEEFLANPNTFDTLIPINVELNHLNKEFLDIGSNIKKVYQNIKVVDDQITTCGSEAVQSSLKVKQCDLLKKNAKQCLDVVNALIDLNKSVSGIQNSLQNEQYEEATDYIIRFKAALGTGDVAETDLTLMQTAQRELLSALYTQLNLSLEKKDFTLMLRYCKLLDLLEEGEKPLDISINYLLSLITADADQEYTARSLSIGSQDTGKDCADILAKLYNTTVAKLNEIESLFITSYPHQPYAYGKLLKMIYSLCEEKANRIMQLYMTKKDIRSLDEQGQTILQNITGQKVGTTVEMLNIIDNSLNEISLILQYSETFDRFIRGRGLALIQSVTNQTKTVSASSSGANENAGKSMNVTFFPSYQERNNGNVLSAMNKYYASLEEVYLIYNMIQAEINETVDANNFTTTYVDDIFFIYKHCFDRVLAQGSIKNLVHVIRCVKVSMEQYLNSLHMSVLRGKRVYNDDCLNSLPISKERASLLIIINNGFLSSDYLSTTLSYITKESQQIFSSIPAIKKAIDDLSQSGSKICTDIYNNGIKRVKELYISPSLDQFQNKFINTSYNLSEAEFNAIQLIDPFIVNYTNDLKTILQQILPFLLPDIRINLLNEISKQLSSKIEVILLKKKYTLLGGLQFDKDMRILIQFLKDMKATTTRIDFAKINQISIILNMDNPKNAYQYFLSDNVNKQILTKHDINTIIHLRITN